MNDIVGVKNYHKKQTLSSILKFTTISQQRPFHPFDDFSMMFRALSVNTYTGLCSIWRFWQIYRHYFFFLQDFYLFKMLKVARSLFKSEKCFQLYEVSGFREAVELLTPWLYQFGLNKSIQSKIDKTENLNCCNRSSQIDGHWSRWEFITFKSWTQHGIEIPC